MVAAMIGAVRPPALNINQIAAEVDWIDHAPGAPRNKTGILKKLARSPLGKVLRGSPVGRRRFHNRRNSGAPVDLTVADEAVLLVDPSTARFPGSARQPHTPAPTERDTTALQITGKEERSSAGSAKTRTPGPRRRRLSQSITAVAHNLESNITSAKTPNGPETPMGPSMPAGEAGLASWLREAGLERVYGLLDCLLFWKDGACDTLDKLREMPEEDILEAVAPLKLKGIKRKKLLAAVATLKGEVQKAFVPKNLAEMEWRDGVMERPLNQPLDLGTSVTREQCKIAPPPRPKIGDLRMPANPEPPRFKPRTKSEAPTTSESEPEKAAKALGLTGPSEAKELGDLAELFGAGSQPSARKANLEAAQQAAAAAKEAAATATEAAAKASEQIVGFAQAKAVRAAFGVEEVTPRTQAAAESLATNLNVALDTALEEAADATQKQVERDLKAAGDEVANTTKKVTPRGEKKTKVKKGVKAKAKALVDLEADKENIAPQVAGFDVRTLR